MEALFTSLGVVAVAEIGDRTQLLALLLATQFRRPIPVICGILVATVANHAMAALAGEWVGHLLSPAILKWVLGLSFAGMAVWTLIPDKLDRAQAVAPRRGAFVTTLFAFFLCEMGDKTQIATAALAARFNVLLPVIAGTTTGMLIANVPAVLFGHYAGHRINAARIRYVAAAIFAAEAALTLTGYSFP
ncbi:MAG TPA: TMEM165/GDT1 family protein [Stellaceae bacterium]|nr:TMEM165/GDT1 family protein [Stellaceae bacterium]